MVPTPHATEQSEKRAEALPTATLRSFIVFSSGLLLSAYSTYISKSTRQSIAQCLWF
jgi:hypothetical protein